MEKENIFEIVIGKNYTKMVEIFLKYIMNIFQSEFCLVSRLQLVIIMLKTLLVIVVAASVFTL